MYIKLQYILVLLFLVNFSSTNVFAGFNGEIAVSTPDNSPSKADKKNEKNAKKIEKLQKFLNSKFGQWLISRIEKRTEKMQAKIGKSDNPKKEARTMANLTRIGLILMLIGLALLVLGLVVLSGALWGLGGLVFLVGLILLIIGLVS